MNAVNSLEPNKIFEFLKYSFELLNNPIGIFLFFCTIIFTCISIFTWPKKHIRSFFISFPLLFLCITIFFYHTVKAPSVQPIKYIEGVIEIMPFGIGYSIIYIIFYWLSVGISFLCSRQEPISTTRKIVLCMLNSIILWIFAKFWFSLATFITLFIDMLISIK